MHEFDKRPTDKFFSKRGCPLITQNTIEQYPLITVERYVKWYDLYLINPNGSVLCIPDDKAVTWEMVDEVCDFYSLTFDHSYYPISISKLAKHIGAKIEIQSYDAICRRFLQDAIELSNVFTEEFFTEINSHTYFNAHLQKDPIPMTTISPDYFPNDELLKEILVADDIVLIN